MQELIRDFLKEKVFAVAGSFRNQDKFAYRIFKGLREKGYEVFPVNPKIALLEGVACYKSITDISSKVGVVNLVTPPYVTESIVRECLDKKIKKVWMQPGAESKEAIDFCRLNGIAVVYGVCVMMELL
ncbi:MAG: CoA-binding protein [Candidatus Omnitrophota bacterium]